ncbi:YbjQ family protein [Nocardia sp. NPDC020380]|uniref:YbjQ family protein n=1 Tax=Nocardia sp. NPDC020380 TaxID=3364309 RepID=UPI0037B73102
MSINEFGAAAGSRTDAMIVSTMNDLPGYEVVEVLGDVFGLTVRSRHLGSQIGAGLKSMFGGELKGMTKMLYDSRVEAQERMIELAQEKGAQAILAMRFDANDFGDSGQEICAYGTAVRIRKL